MARLLQLAGHDVRVAHDGRQALEIAGDFRPRFVLLDIVLPGMDGHEVARQLRGDPRHRDAIIIAISGYSEDDYRTPRKRDSTITWSSRSTTTPCGPSSPARPHRELQAHDLAGATLDLQPGALHGWLAPRAKPPHPGPLPVGARATAFSLRHASAARRRRPPSPSPRRGEGARRADEGAPYLPRPRAQANHEAL